MNNCTEVWEVRLLLLVLEPAPAGTGWENESSGDIRAHTLGAFTRAEP